MGITADQLRYKINEKSVHIQSILDTIDIKLEEALLAHTFVRTDEDQNYNFTFNCDIASCWMKHINCIIKDLESRGFTVKISSDGFRCRLSIGVKGEFK